MKVVFIRNPITPDNRETKYVNAGLTVAEHIAPIIRHWPETEFSVSINGHIIYKEEWDSLVPGDDDCLLLHPILGHGISDFFREIATMFMTMYIMGPSFLPNAGWARPLLQAAGMYIGGRIINSIFPPPVVPSLQSQQQSTTYGWGGPQPTAQPGTPVAKTYGTVRVAPVLLSRYVTSNGSEQYLNLLFSGGEGPVDWIGNILIDGNPIDNYTSVTYDVRYGANDQTPISNFMDTVTDYQLSVELDTAGDWATKTTQGTAVQGLQITVQFPYGLAHINDDGGLGYASVTIEAQYAVANSNNWQTFPLTNGGVTSGAQNTSMWSSFRLDDRAPGQYDVRVRCASKSGTSTRDLTRVTWVILSEIIYDDFSYPNRVLVGIRALATNQLSSSDPTVTWEQRRDNVWVWNPYANNGAGEYETRRSSNPFWACYDLIHQAKYLKNVNTGAYEYCIDGNPYSRIVYDAFAECAAYADEQRNGDNRFNLNIYLSENINFWDALSRLAIVGRGTIIPRGTMFSCICDKPGDSVQLFSVGNILQKSFKGEFQSLKDRASSIEVTFPNKYKDYSNDLAVYYGPGYESSTNIANPVQTTYYGITDYEHAYAEAAYLSRCNQLLVRTETWDADIDAIACALGDIVDVQHDIPRWGDAGGRVVTATKQSITLDKNVTLLQNQHYAIKFRLSTDQIIEATVVPANADTVTNLLPLDAPLADLYVPQQYDLYAFGLVGKATKPFKVINVSKSGDQKAKITGIEYVEAVYEEDIDVPVVNYSNFISYLLGVSVSEPYPGTMTEGQYYLQVGWNWPVDTRVNSADIYLDSVKVANVKLADPVPTLVGTKTSGNHTVTVKVLSSLGSVVGFGSATYTITPFSLAPVTNARVIYQYGNAILTWDPLIDSHSIMYEVRKGSSPGKATTMAKIAQNVFPVSGNDSYFIAAYYQAVVNGVIVTIYSSSWAEIDVTSARVGLNIVGSYDEAALGWTGSLTGGAFVNHLTNSVQLGGQGLNEVQSMQGLGSMFYAGGVPPTGGYHIDPSHVVFTAQDQIVNVKLDYKVSGVDITSDFDLVSDVDALADFDGSSSGVVSGQPQITVYSQATGTWSGWMNLNQAQYYGSKFDFQIILNSASSTVTPNLSAFSFTVDVATIPLAGTFISGNDGSFSVTYPQNLNMIPAPQLTPKGMNTGDYWVITSETATGFSGFMYNSSGVGVSRTVGWSVNAY